MKRAAIAVLLGLCAIESAGAEGTREFGGHDVFALAGKKEVLTDCKTTWEDPASKKVYCFAGDKNKAEFAKDTAGYIAKAEAYFKTLPIRKAADAAKKLEQTAEEQKKFAAEQEKAIQNAEKAPKTPVLPAAPPTGAKAEQPAPSAPPPAKR